MEFDLQVIPVEDGKKRAIADVQSSIAPWQLPLYEYMLSLQSPRSRVAMLAALRIGLAQVNITPEAFDWSKLRDNLILGILAKLNARYAPATINNVLAAFKGVAKRVWAHEFITTREYEMIRSVKNVHGSRLAKGRALSEQELHALFAGLSNVDSIRAHRDAAIFALLTECGLRRAECAGLCFQHINLDPQDPYLTIIGKGNKQRLCMIPPDAFKFLDLWISDRGNAEGNCFLRINKYGDITSEGLTPQRIYSLAKEWASKFGMKDWSPHDLRRTFASSLLNLGVDIATVKDMMGHASISTTQRYDKRGNQRMRTAADKLNLTGI